MRQEQYQKWIKSLKHNDLVCLQQPILPEEKNIYRFDAQWRYSIVIVANNGTVFQQSPEQVNLLRYSPATGEVLDPITNKPIPDHYLVPVFADMDSASPEVISNLSIYPSEISFVSEVAAA